MLSGKIHRVTITQADPDYEGSITIDESLLSAAGIIDNELVHVWDLTNGERLTTYAIAAPPDSGTVCANGPAARRLSRGDIVVVASFVQLDDDEARSWRPRTVFVDGGNQLRECRRERLPD